MASQVQIPFEGVILQEHSAPISCRLRILQKAQDPICGWGRPEDER